MRKPEHLSNSGIQLFYKNVEEYYMKYLADNKPPEIPQTRPMSIGSSFDAYVKSYLHERLFGQGHDPRFVFDAIFEAQVEPHNRDWAREEGKHVFEQYRTSGAVADMMLELQSAIGVPKFELEVKGVIGGYREGDRVQFAEVPLLGKPDLFYINKSGAHVVLDWKVNGYCSSYNVSPMQGYVRLRDGGVNMGQHKGVQLMAYKGIMLNISGGLECYNTDWADQLSIYGWLCGEEIGGDFIVAIDQVVCKPPAMLGARPSLRFAEHRLRISADYQRAVWQKARHAWEVVNSDHVFRHMSLEDSRSNCQILDQRIYDLRNPKSEEDAWFNATTRG